jgi:hypothetical protein
MPHTYHAKFRAAAARAATLLVVRSRSQTSGDRNARACPSRHAAHHSLEHSRLSSTTAPKPVNKNRHFKPGTWVTLQTGNMSDTRMPRRTRRQRTQRLSPPATPTHFASQSTPCTPDWPTCSAHLPAASSIAADQQPNHRRRRLSPLHAPADWKRSPGANDNRKVAPHATTSPTPTTPPPIRSPNPPPQTGDGPAAQPPLCFAAS